MMPSRPNGVLNQGTPAYGYGPYFVSATSMRRSAAERRTHWLNRSLDVSIVAYSVRSASNAPLHSDCASSNVRFGTAAMLAVRSGWRSPATAGVRGARSYANRACLGVAACGASPQSITVQRVLVVEAAVAEPRLRAGVTVSNRCRASGRGMPRTSKMSAKSASILERERRRAAPPGCSSRGECRSCHVSFQRKRERNRCTRSRGRAGAPFGRSGCRGSSGRR